MQLRLFNNITKEAYKQEDFIYDSTDIVYFIKKIKSCCITLYGQPGSGKTHLAHIWQQEKNATFISPPKGVIIDTQKYYVIEDVHNFIPEYEIDLCCYYNRIKEIGGTLLLTTSKTISELNIALPDLKSRILSSVLVKTPVINDTIVQAVLVKKLLLCGISVSQSTISYIMTHTERSIHAVQKLVQDIDAYSASYQCNINIPCVRKILMQEEKPK